MDLPHKKIKEGFAGQRMIVLPPDVKKMAAKNELTRRCFLTAIGHYPHAAFHDRERKYGCDEYILLYCVAGHGDIRLQGRSILLTPNTFFILPRLVPHHYKSSADDPWSIYWLHFTGDIAGLLYNRGITQSGGVTAIPYDEKRTAVFDNLFRLLEHSFDDKTIEAACIKLQDYLASFIYFNQLNPAQQGADAVQNSIQYMKMNLDKAITAGEFARLQNLSASHFYRLFKAATGSTPNHYFNLLKVQKSCQYLYFGNRNVKDICHKLGFTDPYYFSRLFKKQMGISPAHYKNQHKKARPAE